MEVEAFPWNDAVVVVDNETPGEDFSLQPEQEDMVKYGSGIVIMQTSWVSAYVVILSHESICFRCVCCAGLQVRDEASICWSGDRLDTQLCGLDQSSRATLCLRPPFSHSKI